MQSHRNGMSELKINNNTNVSTRVNPARPSSPRQFFERLYGHLESTESNTKAACSPGQSELSSSPDILDDR